MKARALASIFLITMLIGNAVALPIIPIIIGIGAISGGIIGYYLGTHTVNQSYVQELEQKYQALLTQNKEDNDRNIRQLLFETYARDSALYKVGQDFGEYTKNYAWALAKYKALKALSEGKSVEEAKMEARTAVMDYYENITKTLINNFNATVSLLNVTLNEYNSMAGLSNIDVYTVFKHHVIYTGITQTIFGLLWYNASNHCWMASTKYYVKKVVFNNISFIIITKDISVCRRAYSIAELHAHIKGYFIDEGGNKNSFDSNTEEITKVKFAGSEVFNSSDFYNAINQIDQAYKEIINEIDTYVENLASAYPNGINLTKFIDPYILASQLSSDLQNYNYSGYAAAELALLGLSTHGLNRTVTILINNTTVTGWLFTDYAGTIERNQTIDPSGHTWLIVTDNGIYLIKEPFKIVDLRTLDGQQLNNTTLTQYVSAQTDVNKIYAELENITKLWEQYLEMRTTVGGGGSGGSDWADSINNFWNSLDWQVKALIIGGGILTGIVLIGRSFGRGGVSVLKVEEPK